MAPLGLRRSEDLRVLFMVGVYFALTTTAFVVAPQNPWLIAAFMLALSQLTFLNATIVHNSIHVPIFRTRRSNRIFQCAMTMGYGHPMSAFVPGHTLSHHMHTQSNKDLMRTAKARFKWNFLNQLLFLYLVAPAVIASENLYIRSMRTNRPAWYRQLWIERIVLISAYGTLLLIDWKSFLLFVLIPHHFAAWGIVGINYIQHDGTDPDHPVNHSRNLTGRLLNWWTFNNGYHGIHHLHPGMHWADLPAAHAKEIAPTIHPALDVPNLPVYAFQAYVWPGKRLRYDGTPVVLPPESPDEHWIPHPRETPPAASLGAEA